MKKRFIYILIALMCFMLCACGGGDNIPQDEAEDTISQDEAEDSINGIQFPAFVSTDLDGNEVTDQIFAEKDITVLNVWGTYCPPCINEMPGLAKWDAELPDNVQLVGLVIDVGDRVCEEYSLALEILDKSGAEFTNIIYSGDFDPVLEQMVGVPTTFFIDPEGNVLDAVIGADIERYRNIVSGLL